MDSVLTSNECAVTNLSQQEDDSNFFASSIISSNFMFLPSTFNIPLSTQYVYIVPQKLWHLEGVLAIINFTYPFLQETFYDKCNNQKTTL